MVFSCTPMRPPMSKIAVIFPFSPGAYVSLSRVAVVQPQEVFTSFIFTVFLPMLVKGNSATTFVSEGEGWNSRLRFSHFNCAQPVLQRANVRIRKYFAIFMEG